MARMITLASEGTPNINQQYMISGYDTLDKPAAVMAICKDLQLFIASVGETIGIDSSEITKRIADFAKPTPEETLIIDNVSVIAPEDTKNELDAIDIQIDALLELRKKLL